MECAWMSMKPGVTTCPVAFTRDVARAVRKAPRGPIPAELLNDVTQQACERAGLRRVGPHRLRHALAAELIDVADFAQRRDERGPQARLLPHLAGRGLLGGLPGVHVSLGECPQGAAMRADDGHLQLS